MAVSRMTEQEAIAAFLDQLDVIFASEGNPKPATSSLGHSIVSDAPPSTCAGPPLTFCAACRAAMMNVVCLPRCVIGPRSTTSGAPTPTQPSEPTWGIATRWQRPSVERSSLPVSEVLDCLLNYQALELMEIFFSSLAR